MNIVFGEKQSDRNRIVINAPANDDHNLVPRGNIHSGHTVYEVNIKEGTLDEVKYENVQANFLTKKEFWIYKKKPHCIYIPALNEKNALKKLIKIQASRGITVKEEK